MRYLVVTNNSKVFEKHGNHFPTIYLESEGCLAVLSEVRNRIHTGFRLLTHPMTGSLKPNQSPYKSILLEDRGEASVLDYESLRLIENSIEAAQKFLNDKAVPRWNDRIKEDFKTVDLSLFDSAAECPTVRLLK